MKKTDKPNPITFFRKANEARQAVVKKSIKKAQYGISTGDEPDNMLINKPGYGAKKRAIPADTGKTHQEMLNKQAEKFGTKPTKIISAEQAAKQGIYHKKGGAIKRKKK
jgi:hypothetical protein